MLGRRAAGVSSSCNLLRRRPRERADPGLVAKSDVVSRIKTEEGRKPAARSSSGSGVRSSCNVPEAPGGLSAEPWSRPPSSPPRRLLSGRNSSASYLVPCGLVSYILFRKGEVRKT
ncbi:PREDICTED: small integral membrane protein 14 isoform X1 [Hipposideros armiger]|uniref:Small integral membrane protein 14 isoform X1 n=1 Tax=Hipposideros armiger TaxID=186990 RepID=A0A8B7R896_HIPAR|nr:PREDICTED: small integral membrane protein 14 isoform X1 [Hipposideros armiger]